MKNRIKWMVGVGALVAAPLSMLTAAPASAYPGIGACATASLNGVPIQQAPGFFVGCSLETVGNCDLPTNQPAVEILGSTVDYAGCMV